MCARLNKTEYKMLARPDVHWFCPGCITPALTAVKTDKAIEDRCREFLNKFEDRLVSVENSLESKASKQDVASISQSLKAMDQKIQQLAAAKEPTQITNVEDSVKEIKDRDSRKTNIVWFGIPESVSEEATTRKQEDIDGVKELCDSVLEVSVEIKQAKRLGKKADKSRPLLVTLENADQVSNVLKNSRKMSEHSNERIKKVSVKRDMTPLEREQFRKLVKLRNQKREEAERKGEDAQWVIRQNKVVNVTRQRPSTAPVEQGGGS